MLPTTPLNTPNKTQYFYPYDDLWEQIDMPFKASTAIDDWTVVAPEISSNTTTWNLTKFATENATWADFIWILAEKISSTDADYATAWKLKKVWIPKTPYAKARFSVYSWTFTAVDVFKTVEIWTWSTWLAVDTPWKWARIMKYISSTEWVCRFSLPETETA